MPVDVGLFERALVGHVLRSYAADWGDLSDVVSAQHMSDPACRRAWTAIDSLVARERPVDLLTVADESGVPLHTLGSMVAETVCASPRVYAEHVRDSARSAAIAAALRSAAQSAETAKTLSSVSDGMARAQSIAAQVASLALAHDPGATIAAAMEDVLDSRSAQRVVYPTGFADLDGILGGGMRPAELVVLAARPSMGKTMLALNIATHLAGAGHRALIASLEMGEHALACRLLAAALRVDMQAVRNGRLSEATREEARHVIGQRWLECVAVDTRAASIDAIRRSAKGHRAEMVVVDYLQLVQGTGKTEYERVTKVSMGLKRLAVDLGIPVLAVSQLSRAPEGRGDGLPRMSDLRQSGQIEQDADVVMLLHRHEDEPGIARLEVAKNRQGEVGNVTLTYMPRIQRFESHAGPAPVRSKARVVRGVDFG